MVALFFGSSRLVAEVTTAGHHEYYASCVASGNDLIVANAPTRLDYARGASINCLLWAISKWEERVTGNCRSLKALGCLAYRNASAVNPTHLAGANTERCAALGKDDCVRLDMAGDGPSKEHVLPLLLSRLPLGNNLHAVASVLTGVAILHEEPTQHFTVLRCRMRSTSIVINKDPNVWLGRHDLNRLSAERRGCENLDELVHQRGRDRCINLAVESNNPAEGRDRVALECRLVSGERVGTDSNSARIVVLDDDAGCLIELINDSSHSIEVKQVVVREILA